MPKNAWNTFLRRWARVQGLLWLAVLSVALVCQSLGAGPKPAFREGRILLKPKPGRAVSLAARHAAERARVIGEFANFDGIQVLELPAGAGVLQMVEKYQKSGEVEFAEPDYIVHAAATPNETAYANGTLWHLFNISVPGADIYAAAGWDATNSATNIIVAVVDSGVLYTHEDLAANIWVNPGEIPGNNKDDDHDGVKDDIYGINAVNYPQVTGDPTDDLGHGTHVAGIIGAVGNNGLGACGVAWHVRIMACKFLDNTGSGAISAAVYCLDYARGKGAKVINASFADTQYSATLFNAINNCRTAGIIVVAAAGNSTVNNDVTPFYPASFTLDNIVAVAATTRYDELADYSNFGPTNVDLGAPGSEIYSTVSWSATSYNIGSGTSFAAPCVVGAVALMRARFPTHTYRQIIDRLLATTDPLPTLAGKCVSGGRLNLDRALNHFPPTLSIARIPNTGTVRLQLVGEPYQPYILQSSPDFQLWTPLSTNTTPVTGSLSYTNSMSGGNRFYRTALAP